MLTASTTSENCAGGSSRTAEKSPARRRDPLTARLLPEQLEHLLGSVDAVHGEAPLDERQREATGSHSELEDRTAVGELRQPVDRGLGVERISVDRVVVVGDEAAVLRRVVLSHRRLPILAPVRARAVVVVRLQPAAQRSFGETWPRSRSREPEYGQPPRSREASASQEHTERSDEPERREQRSRPREDRGYRRRAADRSRRGARR